MPSALSIIIPTLDESEALPILLGGLRAQIGVELDVIVVDAGSTDDTRAIAADFGARILRSEGPPGRATQMNLGARRALHDPLLFLHADSVVGSSSFLADALDAWVAEADSRVAGHFPLDFDQSDALRYVFLARKTARNRPHSNHGDQGLLISKSFFEEIGGFDDRQPFLEDQRIAREIRSRGRWMTLPGVLGTSTRRFEAEGFFARYVTMALMMGAFEARLTRFFEHADGLYGAQGEAVPLDLRAIFGAVDATFAELSSGSALLAWMALGAFARENLWQVPLLADVLTDDEFALLARFEAHVEPKLDNVVCDAIAAALVRGTVRGAIAASRAMARLA